MNERRVTMLVCAAFLGVGAAFLPQIPWPNEAYSPLEWAGIALRQLSLSGFLGNFTAWLVVAALSALPLLLLKFPKGRGPLSPADLLLPLSSLLILLGLFFSVNPTLVPSLFPQFWCLVGALGTALCGVISWAILRLLEPLDRRELGSLADLLARLLVFCALVLVFFTAYEETANFLTQSQAVPGTDAVDTASPSFTIQFQIFLALASAVPGFLGGGVLLWGSDLTQAMTQGPFEEETLALCEKTAKACRRVATVSVLLSLGVNLFQLLFSSALTTQHFAIQLPLTTLALSAALFLFCRCIQQGKALLDDSRSII